MNRILLAFAVIAIAGRAYAAPLNQTGTVTVQTNVVTSCQFDTSGTTASLVDLGAYDPLAGSDLTNASSPHAVTVLCTPGTYKVTMSNYTGKLSSVAGDQLNYSLAPTAGSFPVTVNAPKGGSLAANLQTFTLTATVAKNQFQPVGTYSETVTLTLSL